MLQERGLSCHLSLMDHPCLAIESHAIFPYCIFHLKKYWVSAGTKELYNFCKPLGFKQNRSVKEDDKRLVSLLLKYSWNSCWLNCPSYFTYFSLLLIRLITSHFVYISNCGHLPRSCSKSKVRDNEEKLEICSMFCFVFATVLRKNFPNVQKLSQVSKSTKFSIIGSAQAELFD